MSLNVGSNLPKLRVHPGLHGRHQTAAKKNLSWMIAKKRDGKETQMIGAAVNDFQHRNSKRKGLKMMILNFRKIYLVSSSEHNCYSIFCRKAKALSLRKPEGEGNEGD